MIKKTEKEKEKGYTRMGVYMMESGQTTKNMAVEITHVQMEHHLTESFEMMQGTDKAEKYTPTAMSMQESLAMIK